MARLYADENFPLPVVEELRRLGHDVLTMHEAGKADQAISDEEVLQLAIKHERALLTMNRKDFFRLHQRSAEHFGIVACTFDPNFQAQAQRISEALNNISELQKQLIRIYRPA